MINQRIESERVELNPMQLRCFSGKVQLVGENETLFAKAGHAMDTLDSSPPSSSILAMEWIVENQNRVANVGIAFSDCHEECEAKGASVASAQSVCERWSRRVLGVVR